MIKKANVHVHPILGVTDVMVVKKAILETHVIHVKAVTT